jgi:predicted hotdog family 3-hydroxylacyl-ACP dehydratase
VLSELPEKIGREWIAKHIPHAGAMCLIDNVKSWDRGGIHCATSTHQRRDNPLRAQGRLGAFCGIEYAAQAMAIHGAILRTQQATGLAPDLPVQGYLAAVRDVQCHMEHLDMLAQELEIVATRLAALAGGAIYHYDICHGSQVLQTGRVTLMVAGAATASPGADT